MNLVVGRGAGLIDTRFSELVRASYKLDAFLKVIRCEAALKVHRAEVMKVTAENLVVCCKSKHLELLSSEEEDGREQAGPSDDADAAKKLSAEEGASVLTTIEDAVRPLEEGEGNAAPDTAEAVHLRGLKGIINLDPAHESSGKAVND